MEEINRRADIETMPESSDIACTEKISGQLNSLSAVKIKSDWWALRADLKPMSEYRQFPNNKV